MADTYLVDTSVFLRWFIDQDGYEHAREIQQSFIEGSVALETVDFARIEVAGVLRKKGLLPKRLSRAEFAAAVRVIDDLGVVIHAITADRLEQAADLSARKRLGMYDALFAQLAIERRIPLLTADAKLRTALTPDVETELLRASADPRG
ncbi:type II toxin-antitoxin system VapC family toxin [Nocardia sp. NPDC051052]|uniref:type II toxin-antitoxin system VapC family toxin n=1 Tax=Nocardia sp. NPDC051052 TaxID=3364322 RepID=UPI00379ED61E